MLKWAKIIYYSVIFITCVPQKTHYHMTWLNLLLKQQNNLVSGFTQSPHQVVFFLLNLSWAREYTKKKELSRNKIEFKILQFNISDWGLIILWIMGLYYRWPVHLDNILKVVHFLNYIVVKNSENIYLDWSN